MRTAYLSAVALAWLAIVLPAGAADLSKIGRTLKDQPAYKSSAQQYCLLVFGPEAKTQVWIVLDGKLAHVYASPNGTAVKVWRQVPWVTPTVDVFKLGDVWEADGKTRHTNLTFRPSWGEFTLTVQINGKHEQHAGEDRAGSLRFATRPAAGPIIHFNGPLTLDMYHTQQPLMADKTVRLSAAVGTPGWGAGTFASFDYDKWKGHGFPVAEVEYPPTKPGGPPVWAKYRLDED